MLVRYVLDYADSADHAIELISRANIISPQTERLHGQFHWMIADESGKTYVVEFFGNDISVVEDFPQDKPISTNFFLTGFDGNTATAYYKPQGFNLNTTTLTPHAMGLERYDILSEGYDAADSKSGMAALMERVKYTKAYDLSENPYWYSEFTANYGSYDLDYTSVPEDFDHVIEVTQEYFREHKRNGTLWQTVHSAVYDLKNKSMSVIYQENGKRHEFFLEKTAHDLQSLAQNAGLFAGNGFWGMGESNTPNVGLQRQYFRNETQAYVQETGEYATNTYKARCQGLTKGDFYEYRPVLIRSAYAGASVTGETMPDDWQRIHIIKPANLNYIPQGAYIEYQGNTWIVFKPKSIGAVLGSAIVRRCNAVINTLDWYGNLVPIPMSYAKMNTMGNESHASENSIVAKNYINCICQRNEYSKAFKENARIILGENAYAMRGVNDFTREFTDDPDSVHLMSFTIERGEVLTSDSVEHQCADYHAFSWEIGITAKKSMVVGARQKIGIISKRNGKAVENSAEHPIAYRFESSTPDILSVDEDGNITALQEGMAEITVRLAQNENIFDSFIVEIANGGESYIGFTTDPVFALTELQETEISAALYENGAATETELTFTFAGAPQKAYSAVRTALNTYRVVCYAASSTPLTIAVSDGEHEKTESILLTT